MALLFVRFNKFCWSTLYLHGINFDSAEKFHNDYQSYILGAKSGLSLCNISLVRTKLIVVVRGGASAPPWISSGRFTVDSRPNTYGRFMSEPQDAQRQFVPVRLAAPTVEPRLAQRRHSLPSEFKWIFSTGQIVLTFAPHWFREVRLVGSIWVGQAQGAKGHREYLQCHGAMTKYWCHGKTKLGETLWPTTSPETENTLIDGAWSLKMTTSFS